MARIAFTRLLLVVIMVPVLVLTTFASRLTYEQWLKYRALTEAERTLRLAVTVTRFVAFSFPAEGLADRNYLADAGTRAQLEKTRLATDEAYKELLRTVAAVGPSDPVIKSQLRTLDEQLKRQPEFRARIDARSASFADIAAFRAPTANHGIDLVGRAAAVTRDETLSRRIFGLYALMKLNSATISQRNYVQQALQDGQLPLGMYSALSQGIAQQDNFGKLASDYALPSVSTSRALFFEQKGRDYKRLQSIAASNSGQKAAESDIKAWIAINQDLLNLDS